MCITDDAIIFLELEKSNQGKVTIGDKKYGKIIGVGKVSKSLSNLIENVYFKSICLTFLISVVRRRRLPSILLNVLSLALKP